MLWLAAVPAAAQTMIIGIDEKVTWDAKGKQLFTPPGKDAVSVVDISNPEAPKIIANYMDRDVSILKVEKNGRVVNTGKSLKLPGQPASMRGAK